MIINISAFKKSLIFGLIVGIIVFILSFDIGGAFFTFIMWVSVSYIFFWIKDIDKKQGEELNNTKH